MTPSAFHTSTGAGLLRHPPALLVLLLLASAGAGIIALGGLTAGLAVMALPVLLFFFGLIIRDPRVGITGALLTAFFLSGLARYIPAPWGLGVDVFLFVACLGMFFHHFRQGDWRPVRNDICLLALLWFGYVILELFNPEAQSRLAWVYAMRGVGFYQLLTFVLVFTYYRHPKHLDRFLYLILFLSILGSLWGLRQELFGTDWAEDRWLYELEHHEEHILWGKLRVFSFYSDAGQFGASQAMFALICGIIALAPISWKQRWFFIIAGLLTFTGFMISGTRGALAAPAGGTLVYMIVSRNFKILIAGVVVIGMSFFILKHTYLFHGIEEVRRMRTALSVDNPSLQARLRNQVTFGHYLASRPFGGGIGSAGFWGERFSPGTVLADTPTDSYYVKIWAETGIVGLCFHVFMLGYFMGKGGYIVWRLRHPVLRQKIMALYCGFGGILLASYGNQVFSQMPTGMIISIALPLIFMAPIYDRMMKEEENTKD